jgi:hypothetical protein
MAASIKAARVYEIVRRRDPSRRRVASSCARPPVEIEIAIWNRSKDPGFNALHCTIKP